VAGRTPTFLTAAAAVAAMADVASDKIARRPASERASAAMATVGLRAARVEAPAAQTGSAPPPSPCQPALWPCRRPARQTAAPNHR